MKQHGYVFMSKIPEAWGISGNAFGDTRIANATCAFGANPYTTFTNAQRQAVAARKIVVVTRATRDIFVT